MQISSLQNTSIKNIVKLKEKSQERFKQQLFVIEGAREIRMAFEAGYLIDAFFHFPLLSRNYLHEFNYHTHISEESIFEVSAEVYGKIATRDTTEGMLALAKMRSMNIEDIHFRNQALIVILESVEKPGNLGAILRTADAANADAVIICDPKVDFYNPNVIRSSVGCVFTRQIARCTNDEAINWLRKHTIKTYAAELKASVPYHTIDFTKSSAIVLGTEANGLSDQWIEAADQRMIIPMNGQIDSLNVSVSAGIIIFEALRQRTIKI